MRDYGTSDSFDTGNVNMLYGTIPEAVTTDSHSPFRENEDIPITIDSDRELIESTGNPVITRLADTPSVTTASDIRGLHVDDEPGVVELSEECVRRGTPEIEIVRENHPAEALDTLECRKRFDCIVSDVVMPEIDRVGVWTAPPTGVSARNSPWSDRMPDPGNTVGVRHSRGGGVETVIGKSASIQPTDSPDRGPDGDCS